MKNFTLGSLFDGIGGWQLAAVHEGIEPKWASELDVFPISVTAKYFPNTKQLGDITKIKTEDLESVDIICAGSPCQDLSVAGKRAGLEGERSGLFHTAIKIVHGLRERTGKPRFFVWENVPGAFSSNKGLDFKAVLEEIGQTEVPMPSNGRWATAGMAELPECDIAWRVLDAQYWGVPQRRKRIFLVADFGTNERCAGKILFEPERCSGDFEARTRKRENTSSNSTGSSGSTSAFIKKNFAGEFVEVSTASTLRSSGGDLGGGSETFILNTIDRHAVAYGICSYSSNSMLSDNPRSGFYKANTSRTLDLNGGIAIIESKYNGDNEMEQTTATDYKQPPVINVKYGVRKLTPLECERLQGLPDGYTAGVDGATDSKRYKAIGNGMAQPCADYVIQQVYRALSDQESLQSVEDKLLKKKD